MIMNYGPLSIQRTIDATICYTCRFYIKMIFALFWLRGVTMLLGYMNIYRVMIHAQQVEGDKLREKTKENNKARTGNYDYFKQKLGGGNLS